MDPESVDAIPGIDDRELAATMTQLSTVPASEMEEPDRFATEVHAVAESRAQKGWAGETESDVGVFVLTPYPRATGEKFGAVAVSNLIASKQPILGKVHFLNRDASYGRAMPLPEDGEALIDWLVDNELGDYPVVFIYRASKLMLVRATGAMHEVSRKEVIRDKRPVATVDEIKKALDLVHLEFLLSPTVCPPGTWEKERAGEYIPGPQAERAIQREVRTGLGSWFRGVVRAEMEDTISVGRIDVRLLQQTDGNWFYWAIVELKVLRSSHNAKKGVQASPVSLSDNAAGVAEGVRQVYAFAKNRGAEPFLEIYDLRKDKTADVLKEEVVISELNKCVPAPCCRVWPLFGSASGARVAGFC